MEERMMEVKALNLRARSYSKRTITITNCLDEVLVTVLSDGTVHINVNNIKKVVWVK